MSCISDIRDHIAKQSDDALITSRDLLKFGYRNAVDQSVYRLIKDEVITRVARGVFIKFGAVIPTAAEIAVCKAKAFGKIIVKHGKTIAQDCRLLPNECEEFDDIFQVNGNSSSFAAPNGRIFFSKVCAKAVRNGDTPVGQLIRMLCFIGKVHGHGRTYTLLSQLREAIFYVLLDHAQWMPSWLSDQARDALEWSYKSPVLSAAA